MACVPPDRQYLVLFYNKNTRQNTSLVPATHLQSAIAGWSWDTRFRLVKPNDLLLIEDVNGDRKVDLITESSDFFGIADLDDLYAVLPG